MEVLSNQEIVNRSLIGLMNQKDRAVRSDGSCVYHDTNTGNRCAIGLCVDIEVASTLECRFGGMSVDTFTSYESSKELLVLEDNEFANQVQNCHDEHSTYITAMQAIAVFASARGYSIPQEVDDFLKENVKED